MKTTKVMLLGILIMVLGIGIGTSTTQLVTVEYNLTSLGVINAFPMIASILILLGFIVGLIGFFKRE